MIKLSTIKTEYITDNKTFVKCILKIKLTNNEYKARPLYLPPSIGIAKLHKEDKFDYQTGCRIALAKAERMAYKRIRKILVFEIKHMTAAITDCAAFVNKAYEIIEHNTKYIKKLSNCSEEE